MPEEIFQSRKQEKPKKAVEESLIVEPTETQTTDYQQTQTRAPLEPQEKLEDLKLETELGEQARRLTLKKQKEKLAYVPQADGTMKPVKEEHLGLYETTDALLKEVKGKKQTNEEEKLTYKQEDDGSLIPIKPEEVEISEINIMVPDSHELPEHIKRLVPVGVEEEPEIIKQITQTPFVCLSLKERLKIHRKRIVRGETLQPEKQPEPQTNNHKLQTESKPQTNNQEPTTNNQSSVPQTANRKLQTDDIYELEKDLEEITESGFVLLEKLGTGGQGEVYRAKDIKTGEEVAIKYCNDIGQEVLAKKLDHPNITKIISSGEDKKGKFIVRQYVKGKSLAELLKQGKLSYEKVLKFGKQIVEAIKHLHDKDVVYGDLKPENILVSEDETVKVTDFGLSREVQNDDLSHSMKTTTLAGTPRYMAPERIKKGEKATKQSDVYELGELLFEMLTGELLLGPNDDKLERYNEIIKHRKRVEYGEEYPRSDYTYEDINEALFAEYVINPCLKSNPDKRRASTFFSEAFIVRIEQYQKEKQKLIALALQKLKEDEEKERQQQSQQTQTSSLDKVVEKEEKKWTWKTTVMSLIPGYGTYRWMKSVIKGTNTPQSDEWYSYAIGVDILSTISSAMVINSLAITNSELNSSLAFFALNYVIKGICVALGEENEDKPSQEKNDKGTPQAPIYQPIQEPPAEKPKSVFQMVDELKELLKKKEAEESNTPQPPQQYQTPQPITSVEPLVDKKDYLNLVTPQPIHLPQTANQQLNNHSN